MEILLCADLHSNGAWYEWLVDQADSFDVVAVSGDLLDIFAVDTAGQISYLLDTW